MKRILILLVFSLAMGLAAQEITDFQVSQDNQRYTIQLGSTVSRFNIRADLYVFYRLKNTTNWYKARTLLGRYQDISNSNLEELLYWDPVFDFQPFGDYEFKLYLVNLAAVNPGYDYHHTNSVGLLSPIDINTRYGTEVNGYLFYYNNGPIALPTGSYNVSVFDGSISLARKIVNVEAFGNSYINEDELVGKLNIVCDNPDIVIHSGNIELSSDHGIEFPIGIMRVVASLQQVSPAYPVITKSYEVVIRAGEETNLMVSIPAGRIKIRSNLKGGYFTVNGNKYALDDGVYLSPGRYEIEAYDRRDVLKDTFMADIVDGETTTLTVVNDRNTFPLENIEFFGAYEGIADKEKPGAMALSASGLYNYTGFAGNSNVNLIYTIGLLDRVYLPWDLYREKVSPSFDLFSIGGGFRFSSFQKTLNLDTIVSYRLGIRYPMTTKAKVDTVNYRYVYKFDEEDADGSKSRSTRAFNLYNGLEVRTELCLRLSADWDVYLYGLLQDQGSYKGNWYRSEEVNAWLNSDTTNKPRPVQNPNLPSRMASLEGTTTRFGIGFRYYLWRK